MLVGIWQKRAKFTETNIALGYEQHGFFEQAQQSFEQVGIGIMVWVGLHGFDCGSLIDIHRFGDPTILLSVLTIPCLCDRQC